MVKAAAAIVVRSALAGALILRHSIHMHVALRPIASGDLAAIAPYAFTVSITQSLDDLDALQRQFAEDGLWGEDAGARAIEADGMLVGTCQFYRSAPCIHGYEIGYIVHDKANRRKGYASRALELMSETLFSERAGCYRQQLMIEVWNTPSWKVAERCGFIREGLLRSAGFGRGDPSDCFIYGRTRKDWHEQHHPNLSLGG